MTQRQQKLKELLKEQVSEIIHRELKDPRLGFVTVTDAEITADLRYGKVFVSIMGTDEEREKSMAVLKNSQRFVRQAFAKRVSMKVLPEIEFRLDASVDRGVRIFELLEEIRRDDKREPS